MIPLTADQQELAYRRGLAEVKLLVITTYSDRAAGTVSDTFYFSDESVRYDYGNSGTVRDFVPMLDAVDLTPRTMPHVPSPDGSDLDNSLRATMRVRLKNDDWKGQRVLAHLKADPIEFASVEYATLLIDPAVKASSGVPYRDATALTGDEHVVRFRGCVGQMVRAANDGIDLEFRSDLPDVGWQFYDDPTLNDPLDLGQRMPIVYGKAKRVPCGGWEVGWITTLSQINRSATATGTWTVTDSSGFPASGSFDVLISGERITCSGKTATGITVSARGVGGTTAAVHSAGEQILEVPAGDVVYIAAGHEVSAIQKVYARNPFNEAIVELESATLMTLNAADSTTISGRTVASISISPTNLVSTLGFLSQQAAVTQQPVVSHPVTVTSDLIGTSSSSAVLRDGDLTVGVTGNGWVLFPTAAGTVTNQVVRIFVGNVASGDTLRVYVSNSSTGGTGTLVGTVSGSGTFTAKWYQFATSATDQAYVNYTIVGSGSGSEVREIEKNVTATVDNPTIGTNTAIEAAAIGYGLRFYADVDGYKVPAANTTYSVAAGALIDKPVDAIHHFLAEVCGLGDSAVDWFGSFLSHTNTLGTAGRIGFDLRTLGYAFPEILARMAYEVRANIIDVERVTGTQWKLFGSLSGYSFSSAVASIAGSPEAFEVGRDTADMATRWLAYSDFDPSVGVADESAFAKIARASSVSADHDLVVPSSTEMGTADDRLGVRRAAPLFFLTINDELGSGNALEEMFGYYVHEGIAARRVLVDRVPHWIGYRLERGDIVNYTPAWEGVSAKCRVIEVANSDERGTEIRLAEVE